MGWVIAGWVALSFCGAMVFSAARRRYRPVTIPKEVQAFLRVLEEHVRKHPQFELRGMIPGRFAAVFAVRGQELPASLHHLFRRYEAFPDNFSESVTRFLAELEQEGVDQPSDHDFADAAANVLPQIRSRSWVEEHGGQFGDRALVHRPFTDDLVVCYVIDEPWCMTFICRAHLRQWGRCEEDLFHLATRNLHQMAGAAVPLPDAEGEPVLLRTGDGFDAARVLLLDPEQVEGLLVAMPERDVLWLGTESESDVSALMDLNQKQAAQSAHPITPNLYRMTNGELARVSRDE